MATKEEIFEMEDYIESKLGYRKYRIYGAYGYFAINIYNKRGYLVKTYKSRLTKSRVLETLNDIAEGIESCECDGGG